MLQEDLVLVLLSRDHLIINHQFRDEVLTLSETSLFMEEGRPYILRGFEEIADNVGYLLH